MAERRAEKARQKVEITPEEMVAISEHMRSQKVTKAERVAARLGMGMQGGSKIFSGAVLAAVVAAAWGSELVVPGVGFAIPGWFKLAALGLAIKNGFGGGKDIWTATRASEAEMDERVMQKKINTYASQLLRRKREAVWQNWVAQQLLKRIMKRAAKNARKAATA